MLHIALACDPPHAVLVHKPSWVAAGFRAAGHDVRLVHDLAGVQAADAQCDLILFDHKASGMSRAGLAELANKRRTRQLLPLPKGEGTLWLQWWRDLIAVDPTKPLAEQDYIRSFGDIMRGMNIVFVKERSLLDEYHALGINAHWLDQACPADMPACEHRERPAWDVLVLGSPGYTQRRADARALADAGFRVLWAGMAASDPVPPGVQWHPWVHPLELPKLASRCGVVLGVDWRSDLPGYTSDRAYLACGMGACYLARCGHLPLPPDPQADVPGGVFLPLPPGEGRGEGGLHLHTLDHSAFPFPRNPQAGLAAWVYDKVDDLIELVRTAISDVSERRRRGERSRRLVMEHHTYAHRAAEIAKVVRLCGEAV
ncbi:MAG TPA: glycosyltransferase [Pirellulales bacterium]